MKKLNLNIIFFVLMAVVFGSSCKKELDIPSRNSIDAGLVLTSKAGIEAASNSVYAVLKSERLYGRDMFSVADALADIGFANGRSSRLLGENRNTSGSHMANWATSYGAINEINLILAAIPDISDATASDKTRWEGELKFLRALYYFDLVKNYAYIPTYVVPAQEKGGIVVTLQGFNTPEAAIAFAPARASIAQTYAQIMVDIYSAMALLPNNGRGGTAGRNYGSKHAALALGSRVTLYQGNWVKADSFATAAITLTGGLGTMTTTANYVAGWRSADHPEGIFQVWYATLGENLGVNTSLAATHTTLSAPGNFAGTRQGQGDFVPNAFLLTELGITGFPSGLSASSPPPALTYGNDIRSRLFEWGVNAAGHYVEVTKWMGKNGSANWDNTVVLRWPELYLNRAEARYQMGNESGAWADLNIIRTARYVGFTIPVTPLTGQALLTEILRQRMLEFAFEGHRFYDLKRYGFSIIKSNPAVNLPPTDFRLLPRIPTSEVDGNPNLQQNFGY
ncbi:MAG TPA: RagB/SusD family nutrient uptake outer membrane protein [Chitinophagaceae bacterium]|nr:RagB/SusD family nutrient uptake outer membrane protein [Chitinophagaceae bacterium]